MGRRKKTANMSLTPVLLVGIGAVGFVALTKMWMKVTGLQTAQSVIIRQQAELIVDVNKLKQQYEALEDLGGLDIVPLPPADERDYEAISTPEEVFVGGTVPEDTFIGDEERGRG